MPEIHWERGGSNSSRIVACPGSVEMAKRYPAPPSSGAAIDGTHSHHLLEHCLENRIVDVSSMIGIELEDHEGKFVTDKARAARVQIAVDYVHARMKDLAQRGMWPQLHVERFVDAGKRFDIPRWGGSMDICLTWRGPEEDGVEGIDFKDGVAPVQPETYQLVTYLLGIENDINDGESFDTCIATIIQPKVAAEPKSYVYTPAEFAIKVEKLAEAMELSCDPEAPRKSGEHCKFCVGASPGRCPEWQAEAKQGLDALFAAPPVPPGSDTDVAVVAEPVIPFQFPEIGEETSDEQLAQILDAKEIILGLLKEAEAEALQREQEKPGRYENWVIGETRTNRRFAKGALDQIKKMKVKQDVYLEKKLKTPKGVLSSEEFKALPEDKQEKIKELIVKPDGKPVLVPKATAIEDHSDLVADIPKLD
jgi:hypothetical protein